MKRNRLLALCLGLGCGLLADQLLLHGVLHDGYLHGSRIAPFDPPLFCPAQTASLRRIEEHTRSGHPAAAEFLFDRELGWAPPRGGTLGSMVFDWAGARRSVAPLQRERLPGLRRTVCVGCSFTLGDEVADDQTWPYLLDEAARGHEFANLGMGAYGLDQALLRYRRDGRPLQADEVWVGWMPAASMRLLTQYRPAQRHWSRQVLFKPRFRLAAGGHLRGVPNPVRSVAHVQRVLSSQRAFLAVLDGNDGWVARSPAAYAPSASHWLHHSGLGRLALTLHERRDRDVVPWLLDVESEVSRLVLAIVSTFREEVEDDGAQLRLLVLPDRDSLRDRRRRGSACWAGLTDACARAGVRVVDCSAALEQAGAVDDDRFWAPGGHYSAQGNRVVADFTRATGIRF